MNIKFLLLIGAIFGGVLTNAQTQYIYSVTGTANGTCAVFDKSCNMYYMESGRIAIKKMNHGSATTATILNSSGGLATAASLLGDGGAATSALSGVMSFIAVDNSDNIYISEINLNVLRKIDAATGIVTRIAGDGIPSFTGDGGAATAARINGPAGIDFDNYNNLYFADQYNRRIRRIDAATGIITTIGGTGFTGYTGDGGPATAANMTLPTGVRLSADKSILFFADPSNSVVRAIDLNTNIITTVAGTGTAGFSGDGGDATAAQIDHAEDIVTDRDGNLYPELFIKR